MGAQLSADSDKSAETQATSDEELLSLSFNHATFELPRIDDPGIRSHSRTQHSWCSFLVLLHAAAFAQPAGKLEDLEHLFDTPSRQPKQGSHRLISKCDRQLRALICNRPRSRFRSVVRRACPLRYTMCNSCSCC
jgi:hypothetical protein